jgi:hypothetical protein
MFCDISSIYLVHLSLSSSTQFVILFFSYLHLICNRRSILIKAKRMCMEGERSEAWFSGLASWTNISGVVM